MNSLKCIYQSCCKLFMAIFSPEPPDLKLIPKVPAAVVVVEVRLFIPKNIVNSKAHILTGEMDWGPFFDTDAETVLEFHATQVICKRENLLVLKCMSPCRDVAFCLKLRTPIADIEKELQRFRTMQEDTTTHDRQDISSSCMADIYGFFKFKVEKEEWGCLCMENYDLTATEILYEVHQIAKKPMVKVLVNTYTHNKGKQRDGGGRGVSIAYIPGRSIYTSVLVACIQLLHKFHSFDWAHGDTHLSNFLIKVSDMRIVLIDCERSFKTLCPRQKLLDIQEFMGHALGLTVSYPYNSSWDMREVQAVTSILHPFNAMTPPPTTKKRKKADPNFSLDSYQFSFTFQQVQAAIEDDHQLRTPEDMLPFLYLPVCSCFTREQSLKKIAGCIYCKSKFNMQSANLVYAAEQQQGVIQNLILAKLMNISWTVLNHQVQICRKAVRLNNGRAKHLLVQHKEQVVFFLSKIRVKEISYTHFENEIPVDRMDLCIQRLLYLGAYIPKADNLSQKFLGYLKKQKLDELRDTFQSIIVPGQDHQALLDTLSGATLVTVT